LALGFPISVVAFVLGAALTGLVRRVALARNIIDVPNERSSHSVPTPRGGGLSIVLATLLAAAYAWGSGACDGPLFYALLGGGIAVAAVGFADDHRPVPARVRFSVHILAAAWAVYWLGGLPSLHWGGRLHDLGAAGYLLGIVGVVWTLNLFNFMDGIDGIAASEASFVGWGAVACLAWSGAPVDGVLLIALALAASSAGFAVWNWPPARIFMGDVGSGFVGFVIAVLALAHARIDPVAPFIWAILGALFIADSGVTLVRRFARGERPYEAHRTHAYQNLSRRWGAHRPVTLAYVAANFLWLLPCALYASYRPSAVPWMLLLAFGPTIVAAALIGAGRSGDC
jgi:Fuc2NAc and GlcNAc transferase